MQGKEFSRSFRLHGQGEGTHETHLLLFASWIRFLVLFVLSDLLNRDPLYQPIDAVKDSCQRDTLLNKD